MPASALRALFHRTDKEPQMATTETTTAEPTAVVMRFLTVAGAALGREDITVDLTHLQDDTRAKCNGCGQHKDHTTKNYYMGSDNKPVYFQDRAKGDKNAREWAQSHAEKCRAMPRPTGR
ncbi:MULTISPECIES: hypothetical protein [Streptomyces]|uniref:hypothetical protein n=1 Tax=Streptomyces TaxID=1883 RepID=UPI0035D6DE1F